MDVGINAEIRYTLLNEPARLFDIDPITGQIRLLNSLANFDDKVFGFDVKATDRIGADDGKSAIANVFVSILTNNYIVQIHKIQIYRFMYFQLAKKWG